jgi:glutamate---cysteine ligase / carboxylate-amine ligase
MIEMPSFSVGVEEEYLLIDPVTRALREDPDPGFFAECETLGEGCVGHEFLRSQVEVGTRVCQDSAGIRQELIRLRSLVHGVSQRYGLGIAAASTHPFARVVDQKHTQKARYFALAEEMQAAARRMLICGMHVHVAVGDDDARLDLMNQMAYFLPHLLALSASSPFWEGEDTGFRSFRTSVVSGLPRSGLPARFASWGEYRRHVDMLIRNGLIEDTSKIWWDIRPSWRYPTLEVRIMDCCTSLEDAVCIAALVQCLLRALWRLRAGNRQWRTHAELLIEENRWRAMRYGIEAGLLDLARGELVSCQRLVEELIEFVREDAITFACLTEVEHARKILARGTSAMRQRSAYTAARQEGAGHEEALLSVVDWLMAETLVDVPVQP